MSGRTTDIVIFASGRGSNLRALCHAAKTGRLPINVRAVLTNVSGSGAAEVARSAGIEVLEVPHAGDGRKLDREEHERAVIAALKPYRFDWIVLAGYMRLFSPGFIEKHWDKDLGCARMINIHPSLLPAFPGVDGYGQALRYGVGLTGATVHFVGKGLDDGPIVAQRALEIRFDDNLESLTRRGLELEHELYVDSLARLFSEPWRMSSGPEPEGRPRVVFSGKAGGL